jgi:hypothetical protein
MVTNKLTEFIKLSRWWLPQTSSTHIREWRRFESMYTMQGKTRSTRHTLSTLDSRMVLDHTSPMDHVGNLSLVPIRTKQTPTPGRSLGDRRQMSPTVILRHLIPPPPHDSHGVRERGFGQVVTELHQLTGPITPACDRYVQYLLVGTNPSDINRHRRGL